MDAKASWPPGEAGYCDVVSRVKKRVALCVVVLFLDMSASWPLLVRSGLWGTMLSGAQRYPCTPVRRLCKILIMAGGQAHLFRSEPTSESL